VPNHEDVDSSEHQIRLSLGVIDKVVYCFEFDALFLGVTGKSQRVGGFCVSASVTGTVSIFRIANWWV
jgi:hypothetical protein